MIIFFFGNMKWSTNTYVRACVRRHQMTAGSILQIGHIKFHLANS
jgi:hypothetical protein